MIIDTDVLIWYTRGNEKAFKVIEELNGFFISALTYIEFIRGMRNNRELKELRNTFRIWDTRILYLNEEISVKAMFFIERYFLSHSFKLADALIAATALVNGLPLLTGNTKHFKVIKELELKKFSP